MAEVKDPALIAILEQPQTAINAADKPPQAKPGDVKSQAKRASLESLVEQINRVQELYEKSIAGRPADRAFGLTELLPSPDNRAFDAAAAGLAEQGLSAFRVPGVGAQSDTELRQFVQANKPSASDYDSVIQEKLRQLRARVDATRREMGLSPANWDGQPKVAPVAPTRPVDPEGVGDIGFNQPDKPVQGLRLTAEQESSMQAFLKTKPTADQINAFAKAMGLGPVLNAEEVAAAAQKGLVSDVVDYSKVDEAYRQSLEAETRERDDAVGLGDSGGLKAIGRQGITLGLSDEAAGMAGAITSLFKGESPLQGYTRGRDRERVMIESARDKSGWGGTALEVGSGLLSGNPSALARLPSLGARIGQASKAGAKGGALAGFGYGEGAEGSAISTVLGGAGGAAIGAAIPVVGSLAANRARALRSLFGEPGEIAARQIRGAFEGDGITPRAAGQAMDEAQARGTPAMLADQGENLRGLLASVTRQPGPSRALGLEAVTERQMGQGDRISSAIARDLGPVSNPHRVSEALVEEARTAAAPLYEAFRSASGASSVKLDDLSTRPAFREALKKARGIIEEEGGDPSALGFDLDEAGEVVLTRVPSWEALDYVKRGLDDVVYAKRNPLTGAPELTNETRAVNNTRRMLLARMDAVNPVYAEARAAYAGPAAARDALDRGMKALKLGADDISEQTRRMSPFEMEHYRLGIRRAMTELVASKGDAADKISALTGSPKKRLALQRLFGGTENFDRFLATLGDERAAQLTYQRAATGSPTAMNAAADLLTNDAGLAETAVDAALRRSRDTLLGNVVALLQRARQAEQFGAGRAGQEARESIAAALTQTDPVELQAVFREASRALARRRATARRSARRAVRTSGRAGQLTGTGIGAAAKEPELEPR